MQRYAIFAVLLAAVVLVGPARAAEQLTVGVGEQKIVSVPRGADITYTGPLHISRLDASRVKIIGDSPGWGSVTVQSGNDIQQYSVTIVEIPPEQTIDKLKSLLGKLNLTYSIAGGRVLMEGRIETTADLERYNRVMELFPGVISMVVIAAREPLIDIAVTLVEVDVTNSSGFGILDITSPTGTATMDGDFTLGQIIDGGVSLDDINVGFAVTSQLLEALKAQIANGKAKIIANPRVVTQNRKEAAITSGGEIPYRVVGATGAQGVEYKPYGIELSVVPEERANDVVMQVTLESSEPVGTVTGASENPLTSRGVVLNVAVDKDKTLAVAGFYNNVTSNDTRAGCLFPLFTTGTSSRSREIVVLITPRVTVEGIQQEYFRMIQPRDMER